MKRVIASSIIGLASSLPVLAGGHIEFSNYSIPPYNQVIWDATTPMGGAVNDPSVEFQIYYAEGIVTAETLMTPGVTFNIDPSLSYDPGEGYGPGGYFDRTIQQLPDWQPGDIYTFQIRVVSYGTAPWGLSVDPSAPPRTVLWQESARIGGLENPAPLASQVPLFEIGLLDYPPLTTVPEPTLLTLLSFGSLAILVGRRRR